MKANFILQDLREVPQFAEGIVQASFAEWGAMTDLDIHDLRGLFDPLDPPGKLPVTLVASSQGKFAGFVSLRHLTMGAVKHPEYYIDGVGPWLSNMWIEEWARGQGLASALTNRLQEIAQGFGFKRLYSSTAEPNSLYHRLGYRNLDVRNMGAFSIYLIVRDM